MNTRQTFSKVVIVSFALTILFFLIGASGYGVIQISSLDDLKNIGNDESYSLGGEYELTQDIDASDTINLNGGAGFAPIGNDTNPFTGVFDGKGHKIRNLYINRPSQYFVGLFGYVGSGVQVKNVGLENVQMVGDACVGGLVGMNFEGTVSQSYSTGSVVGSFAVGGLVGENCGTVVQSYSTGSVVGDFAVGGLVGNNDEVIVVIVSQSYSTCSVSGVKWVGGLVGANMGPITHSYSTGSMSGVEGVGGLVGANAYAVTQSYSTGSVSGKQYVGGLVGYNDEGTVSQSYSTGSVSGSDYLGGLVGMNFEGTVSQSYWDTQTSGQSTSVGGDGKTTAQMKQQATYVGWDFVNVWDIIEGVSYPYLRSLGPTQGPEGEGSKEGSVEGAKEGEGQVQEGGKEGQVGPEGSPSTSEGEGSTETPTETKQGCGCSGKSLGNDTWWKYILDVILFGMLIVSMSGMRRRR